MISQARTGALSAENGLRPQQGHMVNQPEASHRIPSKAEQANISYLHFTSIEMAL